MTTFLLVRHGLNDFTGKRLAGRLPGVHLNEAGRAQALKTAEALRNMPISAVYASPLERTIETAQPIAEVHQLPVLINDGLIEMDFGDWVGQTEEVLHARDDWKTLLANASAMRFAGGETYQEAQTRMVSTIESLRVKHHNDQMIVCVTHCDTVRLILAHYFGMPLDLFHRITIDTASISMLEFGNDIPRISLMNYRPDQLLG